MATPKLHPLKIDPGQYFVLTPSPPFVNIILQATLVQAPELAKIVQLASRYPNDPRLIEMVRQAGDASAKVPYLLDAAETPDSILAALRAIAQPHVERLHSLPPPLQATIHLLLSINAVPYGSEAYALPALLEIDQMQHAMLEALRGQMSERPLALEFHAANQAALKQLDEAWPRVLQGAHARESFRPPAQPLPEAAQMHFAPFFDQAGRLLDVQETCVIVEAPQAARLRELTPPVLRRPLPEHIPTPAIGSADWLIREVGKVGRHFTRALLELIRAHLVRERVALVPSNFELIHRAAQDALREFVEDTP